MSGFTHGRKRAGRILLGLLMNLPATMGLAYSGSDHQFFTFLAAKQFNRCIEGTELPPLTPLQVRYMARANSELAERNLFARMFNWRYYDREDQSDHTFLWIVNTRFHDHYDELARRTNRLDDPMRAYQNLGRLLSYIQLVTSPARAVPVYAARFWRFSFSDRFDSYPVDEEALALVVEGDCSFLDPAPANLAEVLRETADVTIEAVRAPIDGMPVTWTAFWKPAARPGEFGDYGPAGNNFGRRVEFRCGEGERCVLLRDDPLYRAFALARHRDAVRGSQRAMLIMQRQMQEYVTRAR